MSRHRGRSLLRPLFVVPAVVLVLTGAGVVAWSMRDPGGEGPQCVADEAACSANPTLGSSTPESTQASASVSRIPPSLAAPSSSPTTSGRPTAKPSLATSKAEARRGACDSPETCGYPHSRNTGPRIRTSTKKTGDISIKENGAVIKGWDLQGSLDVYANNVTITDCRIRSSNWWGINLRPGFTGLKITHCRISDNPGQGPDNGGSNYAVSNMGDGTIEVGWNDISGFGNVLSMGHGNIHDNYVHDLSAFVTDDGEWQHTDVVISNGSDSGGLMIRHNTLLNPTPVGKGSTAAVGLFADNGPVRNTTVQDNWMAGGAYVLYGGAKGSSNVKIIDNVFSTQYHPKGGAYGFATAWDASGPGNVWSGNRTSAGAPVGPPSL